MFGERALHTRRKGLENKIEERAEESDKAAVRRERQYILKCELLKNTRGAHGRTHVRPLHFPPSRIWALKTMIDP